MTSSVITISVPHITWLPTFLRTDRGLTVVGSTGYLAFLILGNLLGYLAGAWLADRAGRRPTFLAFAVGAIVVTVAARKPRNDRMIVPGGLVRRVEIAMDESVWPPGTGCAATRTGIGRKYYRVVDAVAAVLLGWRVWHRWAGPRLQAQRGRA